MKARALLQQAIKKLSEANVDVPRTDAELLLRHTWNISQTSLFMQMNDEVPEEVISHFDALLERRVKREPLAYIFGKKAFWKHEFVVTSDVLVPRPETEHLIEMVLKYMPELNMNYRIADIGTGSGCIAITLADEYLNSEVAACDISDKALKISTTNAERLGVSKRMSFYQGDLYQALPERPTFDVIVSNPPYVSQAEMLDLEAELSFEPRFALTDESSGLTLLERLLKDAHLYLKPEGLLVLESGLCGMPKTPETLVKLEDYNDLAGNFRGTVFRKV
ncbi:MAG: peptide chain release factor N(5)-glutamine methyltransferase [Ghiorsea sp.]